jgi:uncharacterized membrane protein YesL
MATGGLMVKLYRLTEWITRLAATNLLWIVFNIPVAYLTFNLFLVDTSDQLLVNLISLAILAPFIFFPATTAIFGVARKWVTGELDIKILRTFWKTYKENYVRSMLGGFVIVPLWLILIIDYVYFSKLNSPIFYLFLAIGIFMFVFTIHFFSNTVHFHLKFFAALKNSFLLAIGHPVHTIGIAIVNAFVVYVSFNVFTFLILLGMGSIAAYSSFFIYHKIWVRSSEQS